MGVNFFTKQPNESFLIGIDFTNSLPSGRTISSGAASSVNRKTGSSSTSTILAEGTTCTIASAVASIIVSAGSSGETHVVSMRLTLDNDDVIEGDAYIYVQEV